MGNPSLKCHNSNLVLQELLLWAYSDYTIFLLLYLSQACLYVSSPKKMFMITQYAYRNALYVSYSLSLSEMSAETEGERTHIANLTPRDQSYRPPTCLEEWIGIKL